MKALSEPARRPLSLEERRLLLNLIDLLAVNLGLLLGLALRPDIPFGLDVLLRRPHWFVLWSFLWLVWAWALDCYEPSVKEDLLESLKRATVALFVASVLFLLVPYITPSLPKRRLFILLTFLPPLLAVLLGRFLFWLTLCDPRTRKRVVILGTGEGARAMAEVLSRHNKTYEPLGFIEDGPAGPGSLPQPVLGGKEVLKDLVREGKVDAVIVAVTREPDGELLQVLTDCISMGAKVIPMPVLFERLTGRVPVEHVGGMWYVAMPLDHPLTKAVNRAVKRAFDIVMACIGLAFFLPLLPFLALAIYLDSPGPVFYMQWRVGRGGKPFRLYKLRTMVPDAERDRPQWAKERDPRVTRVGRFLRKTHLDEFPQMINILKGDMSVVGPRPERPEFVQELTREIPFFPLRHAVKPGMAGWGLVKYGYAASKEDSLYKLQYDLYYIKHWSLWLDITILAKTIIDTVTFRGR